MLSSLNIFNNDFYDGIKGLGLIVAYHTVTLETYTDYDDI